MLNRIANIFKDYTGTLSEESIRKNHILCYELLDEIIDDGVIQTLNTGELKMFMLSDPIEIIEERKTKLDTTILSNLFAEKKQTTSDASKRPIQTSKYKKNEIFVDLLERINITIDSNGSIRNCEILGTIVMKSFLMGSPVIRMAFESFNIPQISFADFVNKEEFSQQKLIHFQPPDGEFHVMHYRTCQFLGEVPFKFSPLLEILSEYKVHWVVKVICTLDKEKMATNMLVRIPLPSSTHNCVVEFSTSNNSCEYKSNEKVVLWGMNEIRGQTENICSIRMSFTKALDKNDLKRNLGPISMKFEIPMQTFSGVQIKYLKIEERGDYNPQRWVRYITQSSSYIYRC